MFWWYGKPKLWVDITYEQAENAQSRDQEQQQKKGEQSRHAKKEKEFEEGPNLLSVLELSDLILALFYGNP